MYFKEKPAPDISILGLKLLKLSLRSVAWRGPKRWGSLSG